MSDQGYTDSGDTPPHPVAATLRDGPEPITPQERATWQAACDAATPGPWVENITELGERDLAWAGCGPVHEGLRRGGLTAYGDSCADAYQRAEGDAAFIALAREALPRLLAENAALHEAVRCWKQTAENAHEVAPPDWDTARLASALTRLTAERDALARRVQAAEGERDKAKQDRVEIADLWDRERDAARAVAAERDAARQEASKLKWACGGAALEIQQLRLELSEWRMDAAAAHSEAADWREAAGELTTERDAARDEAAGYRAECAQLRATVERLRPYSELLWNDDPPAPDVTQLGRLP